MAVRNVKKRKRKAFQRQTRAWLLLLLVFVAELLFYTWCRVQYVNVGYAYSLAAANHQRLTDMQNKLKVELARLKSPERIEKIAKQKLGLVTPSPEQVITLP